MKQLRSLFMLLGVLLISMPVSAQTEKTNFFTQSQEEYLAEHPNLYVYFNQLYVEEKTPLIIAKEFTLTNDQTIQYLSELAKIGIVKSPINHDLSVMPQFLVQGVSQYNQQGPLSRKFTELMLK